MQSLLFMIKKITSTPFQTKLCNTRRKILNLSLHTFAIISSGFIIRQAIVAINNHMPHLLPFSFFFWNTRNFRFKDLKPYGILLLNFSLCFFFTLFSSIQHFLFLFEIKFILSSNLISWNRYSYKVINSKHMWYL